MQRDSEARNASSVRGHSQYILLGVRTYERGVSQGGSNDDYLIGGEGNERLVGGDGADHLDDGVGNDSLTGAAATICWWEAPETTIQMRELDTGIASAAQATTFWSAGGANLRAWARTTA